MTYKATLIVNGGDIPVTVELRTIDPGTGMSGDLYRTTEGDLPTWEADLTTNGQTFTAERGRVHELRFEDGTTSRVRIAVPQMSDLVTPLPAADAVFVTGEGPAPFA